MRRFWACVVLLSSVAASHGWGQEKPNSIPPRFNALKQNASLRLERVLGLPELPASNVPAPAFSADGKLALFAEDLSSGTNDKPQLRTRLLLYDLTSKAWPREFEIVGKTVTALSLSADGAKVLLAGDALPGKQKKDEPATYLSLFDLAAGRAINNFLTTEDYFYDVLLAPDGATAIVSGSKKLKRWDVKNGKEIIVYQEKNIPADSLAYLPDGKQFLAGYSLGRAVGTTSALRWDLGKPKSFNYRNVVGSVTHLAVSRDGKRFASGDEQAAVSLWETDTGKEINTLRADKKALEQTITALVLTDDGKTVFSVWTKLDPAPDDFACSRLIAWDGETNKVLWSHPVSYRKRTPMRIQGDKLLIGGGPNLFETWSIKDGKRLESWGGHKGTVNALAVLPNGDILSAGQEGEVMTWNKGQVVSRRAAHAGAISVMAMEPDRKQWLSGGADQTVKLWSADSAKPLHEFKGHTGPVTSLAFSKDGQWATSGSADRSVKTWDLKTGKEIATLTGHSEGVNAVAISPDDRWLASASDDATIHVWPIKDGKPDPDREKITLDDHKKAVTCLAFSPDGKTLVSGSQDQTLIVWDWAKEKPLRTLPGHKNWITSLLFVDANTVVTTSDDLTMCWWDLASGKEIGRLDFGAVGDCPRCLALSGPDRLLVGSSSWLIYEVQMLKSKAGADSSKE